MIIRLLCAVALLCLWAPLEAFSADNVRAFALAAAGTSESKKGNAPAAPVQSGKEKSKAKPVVPNQLYVVDGCDACAALLKYLKQAGVKLDVKKVERSSCSAYPTVVYTDGAADHGERIYAQQVPLPKSVKVEDARSGS